MSMSMKLCACAGAVFAFGSAALAQTGQTCGEAISIGEGTFNFDSTDFPTDGTSSCGAGGSADIWFAYTPSASGNASFGTCGSSFDTVLALYTDCGAADDFCNDDSCGLQSQLTSVPVTAGVTILVRVAQYNIGRVGGPGVLDVTVTPPPPPAQWDEVLNGGGDAGDQLASAQTPSGSDPFTSISGALDFDGDVDVFAINVCDPANFSATTYQGDDGALDTRLYLFDANGAGVTFNDDVPDGFPGDLSLSSRISGQFVSAPGQYYLAVTTFNNEPLTADGDAIWNGTPYNVERAPDGPGAGGTLASWDHTLFDTDFYNITMTGACFVGGGGNVCDPDVNQDGNADQGDVDYLVNVVAGGPNDTGIDPDFNQDGNVDQGDIDALINVVAGGMCP